MLGKSISIVRVFLGGLILIGVGVACGSNGAAGAGDLLTFTKNQAPSGTNNARVFLSDPLGNSVQMCSNIKVSFNSAKLHVFGSKNLAKGDRDDRQDEVAWVSAGTFSPSKVIDLRNLPSKNSANGDDFIVSLLGDLKFSVGQKYNGLRLMIDASGTAITTTNSTKDGASKFPLSVPSDKIRFAHFKWTPKTGKTYGIIVDFVPQQSVRYTLSNETNTDLATDICNVTNVTKAADLTYTLAPVIHVDKVCEFQADCTTTGSTTCTCKPLTKMTRKAAEVDTDHGTNCTSDDNANGDCIHDTDVHCDTTDINNDPDCK